MKDNKILVAVNITDRSDINIIIEDSNDRAGV